MRILIYILFLSFTMIRCITPQRNGTTLFNKGLKVENIHFTGKVWFQMLVETDSIFNNTIGSVYFEPNARTHWHYHPVGQILLITEGIGWYQEKGQPIKEIHKGDVIKCLPNIVHWHGATSTSAMRHIAIGTNTKSGGAVWLNAVTNNQYLGYE